MSDLPWKVIGHGMATTGDAGRPRDGRKPRRAGALSIYLALAALGLWIWLAS